MINEIFDKIQLGCTLWFIIELIIRFFCSPNYLKFIKSPLNILDCLVTIVSLCYYFINNIDKSILNVIKTFRIVLIIKLFRFSRSLKILLYVLKKSFKIITALLIYIFVMVIAFSSFVYLAEQTMDKNTLFVSIPDSFWWSIITSIILRINQDDY
jgi:hypothetical protein